MVSEGFQRGLKPSVVSEGFQRGLKLSVFIGRSPKEFEEVFGQKHPNTKSYQFLLGKSLLKKTLKNNLAEPLDFEKSSSLERRRNKFSKIFIKNHPMKNHTKFLLGNHPYEALKKNILEELLFFIQKNYWEKPQRI